MKYLEYILKNSFNILFKNTSVPNEKNQRYVSIYKIRIKYV